VRWSSGLPLAEQDSRSSQFASALVRWSSVFWLEISKIECSVQRLDGRRRVWCRFTRDRQTDGRMDGQRASCAFNDINGNYTTTSFVINLSALDLERSIYSSQYSSVIASDQAQRWAEPNKHEVMTVERASPSVTKLLHATWCVNSGQLSLRAGWIEYRPACLRLRQCAFTCVGWQVTLTDPIWQVMLRGSEMGSQASNCPWRTMEYGHLRPFKVHGRFIEIIYVHVVHSDTGIIRYNLTPSCCWTLLNRDYTAH